MAGNFFLCKCPFILHVFRSDVICDMYSTMCKKLAQSSPGDYSKTKEFKFVRINMFGPNSDLFIGH